MASVDFKKYCINNSFKMDEEDVLVFDNSLSNLMVVAKMTGYDLKCIVNHKLPNLDNTKSFGVLSFVKNGKIIVNLSINVDSKEDFSDITMFCINDQKSPNPFLNINVFI